MITRFCQKLGFHGYTDFLEEYLKEIEYTESHFQDLDPNHPFDDQDKNTVIANKIGQLYHEIVDDTLKLISHDALQNAINCLSRSDIIYVYSMHPRHVFYSFLCGFQFNSHLLFQLFSGLSCACKINQKYRNICR